MQTVTAQRNLRSAQQRQIRRRDSRFLGGVMYLFGTRGMTPSDVLKGKQSFREKRTWSSVNGLAMKVMSPMVNLEQYYIESSRGLQLGMRHGIFHV
jgi:hypothetical protein